MIFILTPRNFYSIQPPQPSRREVCPSLMAELTFIDYESTVNAGMLHVHTKIDLEFDYACVCKVFPVNNVGIIGEGVKVVA